MATLGLPGQGQAQGQTKTKMSKMRKNVPVGGCGGPQPGNRFVSCRVVRAVRAGEAKLRAGA